MDVVSSGHRDAAPRAGGDGRNLAGVLTALVVAATAVGCSGADRPTAPRGGYTQKGKASWYGPQFHGRDTASGERFDMNLPSAAHRTLPFGTVVRVENLDNGRVIDVRINDRGPFVRGRIVDLSRAAAEDLGMIGAGVANVRLRVVAWPGATVAASRRGGRDRGPPSRAGNAGERTLQAGAFRDRARAEAVAERVRRHDRRVRVYSDEGWHRVQVRGLSADEADRLRRRLGAEGIEAVVLDSDEPARVSLRSSADTSPRQLARRPLTRRPPASTAASGAL